MPTPRSISKLALQPDAAERVLEQELGDHKLEKYIRLRDTAPAREKHALDRKIKRLRAEKSGRRVGR